ncbi:MAG TPA: hypothetical protein VGV89_05840 [Thermoplasmata archaeon]|nr:hypothetical protein [Thermoplasmata archaeon]
MDLEISCRPLDLPSAERAAAIQTELARLGQVKGAVDVLTAGIAPAGGQALVSSDTDLVDVARATGLVVETY